MIDPATTTKMTVQFNLFGGTVFRLGTEVGFQNDSIGLRVKKPFHGHFRFELPTGS